MQEEKNIREVIGRITRMEQLFDEVLAMDPEERRSSKQLKELLDYYENGQWLLDYELDEQGLLPGQLKRGILSQDGLYNLLWEMNV